MSASNSSSFFTARTVIGLMIVVYGLAQLADNLQWIEVGNLIRYWPFGLILAGIVKLLSNDSNKTGGFVMVAVGLLFATENFYFLRFDVWRWWPLAIVIFGIFVVSKAFASGPSGPAGPSGPTGSFGSSGPSGPSSSSGLPGLSGLSELGELSGLHGSSRSSASGTTGTGSRWGGTTDQKISEFAVWSGVQRRVTSPAFKRADLTAVMGGIEFDLRQAGTDQGEAVIEVFVMWGGIEIYVPPDWSVSNQVTPIMGGAEDRSTGTQQSRHRLIVKGVVVMGGLDIRLAPE